MGWWTDVKKGVYHGTGNIVDGITGKTGADASRDAARTQVAFGDRALSQQKDIYDQSKATFQPYLEGGQADYNNLRNATANGDFNDPGFNPRKTPGYGGDEAYQDKGFSIADLMNDPGYKFRLQQGIDKVQNSAAANGLLHSGNTLVGINNYAQGAASDEVKNAFDRYTSARDFGYKAVADRNQRNYNQYTDNRDFAYGSDLDQYNSGVNSRQARFNRLSQLAGIGTQAASSLSGLGQNFANNQTNTLEGQGNSLAAGRVGAANSFTQAAQNGLGLLGSYFGSRKPTQGATV